MQFSNVLSILLLVGFLACLVSLTVGYYRTTKQWFEAAFDRKYGVVLAGLDTEAIYHDNNRKVLVTYILLFFARRIIFTMSVLFLDDFLVGQLAL